MSWWVKDHIAVNDDETKQLCSIEADTQTSLPAADQTETAGFIIVRGSDALVLDTGDRYLMNSAGIWVQQPSGVQLDLSGYATTQDLADGLAVKVDTTTYTVGQAAQDAEIGAVAALGAKNLLKITASSQTLKGVTFTVNADQTVTVNGTNDGTGASTFVIVPNAQAITIPDGNYILSGCPTGGGASAPFDLRWYMYSPGKSAYDSGKGASIEKSGNGTGSNIAIVVKTGQTANNLVFSPMLRPASITDSTFVPYAKTNVELTGENASQQSEIDYAVNTGAKNFLDVQHPTTTTRTSYTPLANGGVELSCSSAIWTSYNIADIPVEAGKEYIITFLLDELSGTSNFYFFLRNDNSSGTNLATKNYGSTTGIYEASFTPNTSVIWLGIYLNNSATAATATAKLRCMIRPAAITDDTFVPYAPTNRELYEMILALQ